MSTQIGHSITEADRAGWLAARQARIGSSESPAALGISPFPGDTRLNLYLRKIGAAPPKESSRAMELGLHMEPFIARLYREETGCEFAAEQLFLVGSDHPFMCATIDRVRADGRIVELKNVGQRCAHRWGEPRSDEVPDYVIAQVLHQFVVARESGRDVGDAADVAAFIGGERFQVYTIPYNERVAARIVEIEAEFMDRIRSLDPPGPESPDDLGAMALLYPDAEGSIAFDDEDLSLVAEWEHAGADVRYHQEARERCRLELLRRLGPAALATLPDGRILSRKVVSVAEQQITRKAYIYAQLTLRGPKR